jgi:hypothetical protein
MSDFKVEDYVYAKKYTCDVCHKDFENSTIRQGKNTLIDQDSDLRPNYKFVDAVLYDIIHCKHCGYTSLTRYFNKLTDRQGDTIKKSLFGKHADHGYPLIMTPNIALERYKLAIICAFHKGAKNSEKAMLYLKTAWVYRALNSEKNEQGFLAQAFHSFTDAYSQESMPIAGMEEPTFTYLMAELARRNGNIDEAANYCIRVLQMNSASRELKTKAETIRDLIKEARAKK